MEPHPTGRIALRDEQVTYQPPTTSFDRGCEHERVTEHNSPADRFRSALPDSTLLQSATFRCWLEASSEAGVISRQLAQDIASELAMTPDDLMLSLLPFAALFAAPAISGYAVGCIARGRSGALYMGANAEYAGMSVDVTIHAEQTATINAWNHAEQGLKQLAISAAPCGQCRQFLYELPDAPSLEIILPERSGLATVASLLPAAFGPSNLGVTSVFMESANHHLRLSSGVSASDDLVAKTLRAASHSYAPYTRAYAAVGIVTRSGGVYIGRYAENAAFNPSVLPLPAALAMLRMAGRSPSEITRAVLVECSVRVSHATATRALLEHVTQAPLEILYADY